MIKHEDFVNAMEQHWTETLGNVSSSALRRVWNQIADTFGTHIANHGDATNGRKWNILQPPTGSGKSQGTAVYCSMLASGKHGDHPGVLIVTRLTDDADQMAEQINQLSGNPDAARAYHSKLDVKLEREWLSQWPTLVITHSAYERALDALEVEGSDEGIAGTWSFFHDRWDSERKLVIIDEALDIVDESKVSLEGLRMVRGYITATIRDEHHEQVGVIDAVITVMDKMREASQRNPSLEREKMLVKNQVFGDMISEKFAGSHMLELRKALRESLKQHQRDEQAGKRLIEHCDRVLKELQYIIQSWNYFSTATGADNYAMNTARLLVPEDAKGAVVLDATASSNVMYDVFNESTVLAPPPDSRSYTNVTLHISYGHKVGKRSMSKAGKRLSSQLIADLTERFNSSDDVFVVTHKDVKPQLAGFDTPFNMRLGHWGAVDGSNNWKDCNKVVIFGLPYLPGEWASNQFMALQGPQTSKWLQESNHRAFQKHADIKQALKEGKMITSAVQGINRIRCRKVIDAEGNCPTADIYLMLPNDALGRNMLAGIEREMPGIKVVEDWVVNAAKKKARRSKHVESLSVWMRGAKSGEWNTGYIRDALGIPSTPWKLLVTMLRDSSSDIYRVMSDCGFQFITTGTGRGQRSKLVKGI